MADTVVTLPTPEELVVMYGEAQGAVATMRETLKAATELLPLEPLLQDARNKLELALDNMRHVLVLAQAQVPVPPEPYIVPPPPEEPPEEGL